VNAACVRRTAPSATDQPIGKFLSLSVETSQHSPLPARCLDVAHTYMLAAIPGAFHGAWLAPWLVVYCSGGLLTVWLLSRMLGCGGAAAGMTCDLGQVATEAVVREMSTRVLGGDGAGRATGVQGEGLAAQDGTGEVHAVERPAGARRGGPSAAAAGCRGAATVPTKEGVSKEGELFELQQTAGWALHGIDAVDALELTAMRAPDGKSARLLVSLLLPQSAVLRVETPLPVLVSTYQCTTSYDGRPAAGSMVNGCHLFGV
jgi:hypothetical protein